MEIKKNVTSNESVFLKKLCSQKKRKKTGFRALCSQSLFPKNSGSHNLKLDILKMSKKKNRPHLFFEFFRTLNNKLNFLLKEIPTIDFIIYKKTI